MDRYKPIRKNSSPEAAAFNGLIVGGGFSYQRNTSYLSNVLNIPKLLNKFITQKLSEEKCK